MDLWGPVLPGDPIERRLYAGEEIHSQRSTNHPELLARTKTQEGEIKMTREEFLTAFEEFRQTKTAGVRQIYFVPPLSEVRGMFDSFEESLEILGSLIEEGHFAFAVKMGPNSVLLLPPEVACKVYSPLLRVCNLRTSQQIIESN